MILSQLKDRLLKHKFLAVIVLLALAGGGWYWYQSSNKSQAATSYVLGSAEKDTVIASVSGSGQVSATNQVEVKSSVAGDIIFVGAKTGQSVKAGALLAQVNAKEALKSVRDAEASLASAKISLQKLQQPVDSLSLTQSENALVNAQKTKAKAEDDLAKAYEDAFADVSNAFLDLPTVITGISDILYKNSYSSNQNNLDYYSDRVKDYNSSVSVYKDKADADYQAVRLAYDKNFLSYKAASRYDSKEAIEALLKETYQTAILAADSVKSVDNFLSFVKDELNQHNNNLPSYLATHQSSVSTYTSKTNSNLATLLGDITTIKNDKDTITSSDLTIKEKEESLADLKSGTDPLDIESAQLSIKQKENSLLDAKEKLADYYIRAPFDGVVSAFNVAVGDSASASTAIATVITNQKIAEVSFNEVDVAKIKVGQQATLTFDALEELSIAGKVVEVDIVGTASQGVVSYNVKIAFDSQDERIKPGMSAQAAIIIDSKIDVLTVSSTAVKTQGGKSYVEVVSAEDLKETATSTTSVILKNAPQKQTVEIGLSNDSLTEIISGLSEGDTIVVQTITSSASSSSGSSASKSSGSSSIRIPGLTGGGRPD